MWQLQWMISLIPDSFLQILIHAITVAGLALILIGSFAKKIPFVEAYGTVIKGVGLLTLLIGVFFQGGYITEMSWRAKTLAEKQEIERLNNLIRETEQKSKKVNVDLGKKQKEKIKIVREVQYVIEERIKEVEKVIDASCKIEPEAISILNDSARNIKGNKQ